MEPDQSYLQPYGESAPVTSCAAAPNHLAPRFERAAPCGLPCRDASIRPSPAAQPVPSPPAVLAAAP
jgi:hypothetical protein